MLAKIGVGAIDELFADIPPAKRLKKPLDLPKHKSELEVIAPHARPRGEEPRGRRRAVLRRRRRLSPPRAGRGRPHHPALGVPDLLHALPAGDRAGHAAISLRVPDAGREPDRHGGGQRLDVRRLDRDRRGGADGASRDAAEEGGALRRAASALSRGGRDAVAHGRRHDRRARSRSARRRRTFSRRSTTRPPASSCSRRPSTASSSISRRSPRRRTRMARCSSPSSPRSCRSGCSSRPARRAPTSSSAKARGSATR